MTGQEAAAIECGGIKASVQRVASFNATAETGVPRPKY